MCTVSWLHRPDGYTLLCNRDELKTRSAATPPAVGERDGVRYVAPLDGEHGGSWVAVNEYGVALALLNGKAGKKPALRSRGLLVLDWIGARSGAEVCERFEEAELGAYAAFQMAVLEPGKAARILRWEGGKKQAMENGEPSMPLTSSSYDGPGAQVHRRLEFRRLLDQTQKVDERLLHLFHLSHAKAPGPLTACMHREDAETVSFSTVAVRAGEARLYYSPGAPCRRRPGVEVVLERR
jgi:uncharacterized protein with NRDE domain